MGMRAFPATKLGKIPTYYVTDTIQEDAGSGNVRIWNYAKINGVLVPQFQCIIASCRLVTIGRKIIDIAQCVVDSELLRFPSQKIH